MLPQILDVPRRNFHRFFSASWYSFHNRSDADAWSQWTYPEQWLVQIELMKKAKTIAFRVDRIGKRPKKAKNGTNVFSNVECF